MLKKMKKIIYIIFFLTLLISFSTFLPAKAESDIQITADSLAHTVPVPYEKSFRFVATIKNVGSIAHKVQIQILSDEQGLLGPPEPNSFGVLFPTGYFVLDPGEETELVVVFEAPLPKPNDSTAIKDKVLPIKFSWEGGSKTITVTAKAVVLPYEDLKDELAKVNFKVYEKGTNKEIKNPYIAAFLASGNKPNVANNNILTIPAKEWIEKIYNQYQVDLTNKGYHLQVSARGYKSYFEQNFLPTKGDSEKKVYLEPIDKVGNYTLYDSFDTGFSIWWAKGSKDGKYLAFSQGTHGQGQPGARIPSTKITFYNLEKKEKWQKEVGGECWGLDISPNGQYVAAGCHDGVIYLWDQTGKQLWRYANIHGP
ncbi:MAG: WD40 domain-containing protein, partial [Candidatus Omnitrophica bacterium]|nr:WD40 domain-containing protein [Candidatus Omnitrophota bacterium]